MNGIMNGIMITENIKLTNLEFVELYQQFLSQYLDNKPTDLEFAMTQFQNIMNKYVQWMQSCDMSHFIQAQSDYVQDYFKFIEHFQQQFKDKADTSALGDNEPYIKPDLADRRFQSEDWRKQPLYSFWMQNYLLFSKHMQKLMTGHQTENNRLNKQVDFFTQLWIDSLSPSNFHLTNPEVVRQTLLSKGESVVQGFQNFMKDVVQNGSQYQFKMTDMQAFAVGDNIAVTKGKVVYRNRMFELIQYSPTTSNVYAIPLLIVPPWINKYYILDLTEKNSFVKWIVDKGFTVFIISWVNPDISYKYTSFTDYMQAGVLEATKVVKEITSQSSINALGFCIGGTLLAATMGYLKAHNRKDIQSTTYLTSLIDFSYTGDIEVFIDEQQVNNLSKLMEKEGVLSGKRLMLTFNLLRANDLFWSFYINNYLCGKQPFPFDLLYWNCDNVNLPYEMHKFYLENMYLKNNLIKANGLVLADTPIDLSKVAVPSYFLSTEQDHIAPWQTTFKGALALQGDLTFVLGGSGHIAGVVNPPSNQKYGYKCTSKNTRQYHTAEEWLAHAQSFPGSWWMHWAEWLLNRSGESIAARIPGSVTYPPLEDAPGQYVKKKTN